MSLDSDLAADRPLKRAGRWSRLLEAGPQWVLLDQCLVSGGRFLATWLVGRWAGPEALGSYSIAMAVILLAGGVQESLLIRPYQSLLYRRSVELRSVYGGSVVGLMLSLAVLIGLMLMAISGLLSGSTAGEATLQAGGWKELVWVLGWCVPGTMVGEFARRYSLAHLRVRSAIVIDAMIIGAMLVGHVTLEWVGHFNAATALLVIGAVQFVVGGGALGIYYARQEFQWAQRHWLQDWLDNWRFGRWLCGSQLLGVIHGYLVPWLVYALISEEAAGRLSACYTLILFSNPLILGYSSWLGPQSARVYAEQGWTAVRRLIGFSALGLGSGLLIFWVGLIVMGDGLVVWMFGPDYEGLGTVVSWLGATAIGFGASICGANGLAAIHRPGMVFVGTICGIVMTLSTYFLLVPLWQLDGAAAALALGSVTSGLIHLCLSLSLSPAE